MNLKDFVDSHQERISVLGGVPDASIDVAQTKLGVVFPDELRSYLRRFGALDCGPIEFFGLGMPEDSHRNIVSRTLELRRVGLSRMHVAIEDLDDNHFAVCDSDGKVFEWAAPRDETMLDEISTSVEAYLVSTIREMMN